MSLTKAIFAKKAKRQAAIEARKSDDDPAQYLPLYKRFMGHLSDEDSDEWNELLPATREAVEWLYWTEHKAQKSHGANKLGKPHAWRKTIAEIKRRHGPLTFEELLEMLEDADLIDDLHLASFDPIPIWAVEVDHDARRVTYSVIQDPGRKPAANYKTKTISFKQLATYL